MSVQGSLFGHQSLFSPRVMKQYLEDRSSDSIPEEAGRRTILEAWVRDVAPRKGQEKETSLEQAFNQRILGEVLGYTLTPSPAATACPKPPRSIIGTAREPDVVLGWFPQGKPSSVQAVVELKAPGTPLDTPQARANPETPVEQGFDCARNILGTKWILISDMLEIRLYAATSASEYEAFDLRQCVGDGPSERAEFQRLVYLIHKDNLLGDGAGESAVTALLDKSAKRQTQIRASFYELYSQIRDDLARAIKNALDALDRSTTSDQLLEHVQRLLDRMLFIYYCEDHPNHLLPENTVRDLVTQARSLPGSDTGRVYRYLKDLFKEIDKGSPPASGLSISAYNGELFKYHDVIDTIDLPDSLNDNIYTAHDGRGSDRVVRGVWGLYDFDFWQEINEHLLGHIFEASLSDFARLASASGLSFEALATARRAERSRLGVFYTDQVIAEFLVSSAMKSMRAEAIASVDDPGSPEALEDGLDALSRLRIVDFACGSGVFLVSAYRELLAEAFRLRERLDDTLGRNGPVQANMLDRSPPTGDPTRLLREALFGFDLLPQAVEIAKLALWLRSARKGEKVADLSHNLVAGDSLDIPLALSKVNARLGWFDLVVGNPPWGGEVDDASYLSACATLGVPTTPAWDSWELFLMLAVEALREGGRLAMVLPDTIFSPEKERIRRFLLERTRIERFHNLGPDWFGADVRMGTVVVQARRGARPFASEFKGMVLAGQRRRQAIAGDLPLTQLESRLARDIPQDRCYASPTAEIAIFRSKRDDEILDKITGRSFGLRDLCTRGRGEEISKGGLLWVCPSCLAVTTPGRKAKGGGYLPKPCPSCGLNLRPDRVATDSLVSGVLGANRGPTVPFIDGDALSGRYRSAQPTSSMRTGVRGWSYKDSSVYNGPKLLIRQSGVGLTASIDESDSRCPQSVYIYRPTVDATSDGYSLPYLLGCLLSRTTAYYVFKSFSEVDPARAHAKLTHSRLSDIPIPRFDDTRASDRALVGRIESNVNALLADPARLGQTEDFQIEADLRALWGLTAEDGEHITTELAELPDGQALHDLFPGDLLEQLRSAGRTVVR